MDRSSQLNSVYLGVVFENVEDSIQGLYQVEVLVRNLELVVFHFGEVKEVIDEVLNHLLGVSLLFADSETVLNLLAQALVQLGVVVHLGCRFLHQHCYFFFLKVLVFNVFV